MSERDESVRAVTFLYRNWRGETRQRTVLPVTIWHGSTIWHPEPQWLLKAIDLETGEDRDFAMKDIREWQAVQQGEKPSESPDEKQSASAFRIVVEPGGTTSRRCKPVYILPVDCRAPYHLNERMQSDNVPLDGSYPTLEEAREAAREYICTGFQVWMVEIYDREGNHVETVRKTP